MGIDVGRKYVGLAVSDKDIKISRPFRTLITTDAQYGKSIVDFKKNESMFMALGKVIK